MQSTSLAKIFRRGSKSFSLAAVFLDRERYEAACQIYAWCRYCDDAVDSIPQHDRQELERAVNSLKQQTASVFSGLSQKEEAFRAFQVVTVKYKIPEEYPLALIEGLAMDARNERYETLAELEVYAYRVAGTVGMMMTYVLGATDPRAKFHAKQLGIAMQLTNISRDILEDAAMNRVYLPQQWLREERLDPTTISDPAPRITLAVLAKRLVDSAEPYYADGMQGLQYLEGRSALAIASAAGIYRAIGHIVVERGSLAWDSRTIVPTWRKFWEIAKSFFLVRKTI